MVAAAVSVTSKNQITVPKELREDLNIHSGDKIFFRKKGDVWIVKRMPEKFVDYLHDFGKQFLRDDIDLDQLHKEFEEGWDEDRWP
jgi:AbrB family looped-hinge helix DNA binding protein